MRRVLLWHLLSVGSLLDLSEGYGLGQCAPRLSPAGRVVRASPCTGAWTPSSAVGVAPRTGLVPRLSMMAPPAGDERGGSEQALLWADGLSKTHDGQKYQFRDATFVLSRGERVGLIGVNGVGKSTLLKILADRDAPDGGGVTLRKGTVMAYVEQDPLKDQDITVGEALYAGDAPVMKALREFEEATLALEKVSQEAGQDSADTAAAHRRFEKATEHMETAGAWDIQVFAGKAIDSLLPMLKNHMDRPISKLSGGQRKRLALASALLQKPDILLLDEPTNHLDVECIEWLENELQDPKTCLLMVTHDRYFLEKTCAYILELDSGSMYRHEGCYSSFLEARAIREQEAAAQVELAKKQARKELEWVRRMPKAREAKNKARVARYYELETKSKSGKRQGSKLELDQGKANRLGNYIMDLDSVSVELPNGATMLKDFSYEFMKRDRIGIVGPNGVGKTTFLNLLAGRLGYQQGELKLGETVVIGYYEQSGLDINPDMTVLEYVADCGAIDTGLSQRDVDAYELGGASGAGKSNDPGTSDAFKLLDKFQFPRARCYERVGSLSGGERRRLQLLGVLVRRPNVLLLDEPSNDLDITTLGALENYLREDYDGVLAVVSHDRAFMDQVADHLFVFEGDGIVRNFEGRFSEFLEFDKERKKGAKAVRASSVPPATPPTPLAQKAVKLSYKEKREYENLEAEIEQLSQSKSELEAKLNSGAGGFSELADWGVEVERLAAEIEKKELRWLELAEMVQGG